MGLFSSLSSKSQANPAAVQSFTFSITPHDWDHDRTIIITRLDPYGNYIPAFTFSYHHSEPNLVVSRILSPNPTQQPLQIAHATFRYPSKVNGALHSHKLEMKPNPISGTGNRFEYPAFGRFKWSGDNIVGSSIVLYDEAGTKLAKYKPMKSLEILVNGNEEFVDMVVVSALAAAGSRKQDKKVGEGIAEGVGAAVSAS